MAIYQESFLRTGTNGAILVIDNSVAVAPTVIRAGFLRDANGYLVTLTAPTGAAVEHDGFMRDSTTYALLCTDETTATGVVMRESLNRDANGYLVTTTNAATAFQRGFAVDAAGNVCVSGTI